MDKQETRKEMLLYIFTYLLYTDNAFFLCYAIYRPSAEESLPIHLHR